MIFRRDVWTRCLEEIIYTRCLDMFYLCKKIFRGVIIYAKCLDQYFSCLEEISSKEIDLRYLDVMFVRDVWKRYLDEKFNKKLTRDIQMSLGCFEELFEEDVQLIRLDKIFGSYTFSHSHILGHIISN